LKVSIFSFGFKYGPPPESHIQFDVRFLPNPYWVEELRATTGLQSATASYVIDSEAADDFFIHLIPLLDFITCQFTSADRENLTIAVGCTGGRHRSVAVAEKLGQIMSKSGLAVSITHHHINSEKQ
jgi:UPF0042 nucleotide-binding protein